MTRERTPWWISQPFLYIVLAVALIAGIAASVVDGDAKPSFRWFVEGDLIVCRTWGPFEEPLRETYKYERIEAFEVVEDPYNPGVSVVRIRFDQLDLNLPIHNDANIDDLIGYVERLNRWLERVKEGDATAQCSEVQPEYVIASLAKDVAIPVWILLVVLIAVRLRLGATSHRERRETQT